MFVSKTEIAMENPTALKISRAQDPQPNSVSAPATKSAGAKEWRKPVGLILSVLVIVGAVALSLWV